MTFKTLWKICEQNDLEKLKKQNRKKLKTHKQQLFYKCAVFNKFELAKWLYSLGDIDVNYQKDKWINHLNDIYPAHADL